MLLWFYKSKLEESTMPKDEFPGFRIQGGVVPTGCQALDHLENNSPTVRDANAVGQDSELLATILLPLKNLHDGSQTTLSGSSHMKIPICMPKPAVLLEICAVTTPTSIIHWQNTRLLASLLKDVAIHTGELGNLLVLQLGNLHTIMTLYMMNSEEPSLNSRICCSQKRKTKLRQMLQVLLAILFTTPIGFVKTSFPKELCRHCSRRWKIAPKWQFIRSSELFPLIAQLRQSPESTIANYASVFTSKVSESRCRYP